MKTLLIAALLLVCACFRVNIKAPPKTEIVLADTPPPNVAGRSTRHLFFVSGLLPIGDNSTAGIIPPNCKKVALRTEMTAVDAAISFAVNAALVGTWWYLAASFTNPNADLLRVDPALLTGGAAAIQALLVPQPRTSTAWCLDQASTPTP